MYHSLLEEYKMEQQDKKRIVAILCEVKVKDEEIFYLLKKYCNIDTKETLVLIQNERLIDAPCRKLEEFLLSEKGYSYEDADRFINKYAIGILVNNPELSKITPDKLYIKVNEKKQNKLNDN